MQHVTGFVLAKNALKRRSYKRFMNDGSPRRSKEDHSGRPREQWF